MKLIETIQNIMQEGISWQGTNRYFFEEHICSVTKNKEKVKLNYRLQDEITGQMVLFNICPHCKQIFYHKDFYSKGI